MQQSHLAGFQVAQVAEGAGSGVLRIVVAGFDLTCYVFTNKNKWQMSLCTPETGGGPEARPLNIACWGLSNNDGTCLLRKARRTEARANTST